MEHLERKCKSEKMNKLCDIGLVGLGVMGRSLALNMASKGFRVAVYNYIPEVTKEFLAGLSDPSNCHFERSREISGVFSYAALAGSLSRPRIVFMMVTAGKAVDQVIGELLQVLEPGDVIIDGGNSDFHDTERRCREVQERGLLYIGTGVSGGEEGALKGPSMMPGGSPEAWPLVKPILQGISAKVDDGTPCCNWVGEGGAGHFVKMVHNGIEYGDIQLICECYQLMRDGLGMTNAQMQETFREWGRGELDSYLIGITADILGKKDSEGRYILDTILDTAGQKGTGKWTVRAALDEGTPLSLISESVFARCLSALKEERLAASKLLDGPAPSSVISSGTEGEVEKSLLPVISSEVEISHFLDDLRKALLSAKIVSYAQGFSLMAEASKEYGWNLDLGAVALLWRGGCIIRSVFLGRIKEAFDAEPGLVNLMLSPWFRERLSEGQAGWRRVVSSALMHGIPVPSLSAGLNYYDGYRCASLPANLLQAQRDYFGAHTYERTDRPRGEFFHTLWLEG